MTDNFFPEKSFDYVNQRYKNDDADYRRIHKLMKVNNFKLTQGFKAIPQKKE